MNRKRMATAAAKISAHLGANRQQLEQDVAKLGNVGRGGISQGSARNIVQNTLKSDYVTAYRFQSQASHNKPQQDTGGTGMQMAQRWGKAVAHKGGNTDLLNIPREASDHTQGQNNSRFVSLTGDPVGLHNSPDDWARRITRGAGQLHEYTMPKRLTRDSERIAKDIDMSDRVAFARTDALDRKGIQQIAKATTGDTQRKQWVTGTPAQEKEILFMGTDLSKYRSNAMVNPFKKK